MASKMPTWRSRIALLRRSVAVASRVAGMVVLLGCYYMECCVSGDARRVHSNTQTGHDAIICARSGDAVPSLSFLRAFLVEGQGRDLAECLVGTVGIVDVLPSVQELVHPGEGVG